MVTRMYFAAVVAAAVQLAMVVGQSANAQDAAVRKADAVRPASERFAGVQKLLQEQVDRKQIAGAVALVLHRGKPVCFEAFGMADIEAGRPMARDTMFRIASMTKPVTSVAIMMLAEEGKLQLSDPVSKHLPEFQQPHVAVRNDDAERWTVVAANREITIEDLLLHRSGIIYDFAGHEYLGRLYEKAQISNGLVQTDFDLATNVRRLAKLPLAHQPGAAWSYGLSTDVLGRVVEVVSGQPLDEFFRKRIFEPLEMSDTHFFLPGKKRERLAALYAPDKDGGIRRVDDKPQQAGNLRYSASFPYRGPRTYHSGGAGLVSTARDYGRFLQMLLQRGELDGERLLRPETVERMTRHQIDEMQIPFGIHGDGFGYGFGVVTERAKPASPAAIGSYSWGGIFHTFFWVDPREELIGIVLTQLYPFGHLTLWQDFQSKVYDDLHGEKHGKFDVREPFRTFGLLGRQAGEATRHALPTRGRFAYNTAAHPIPARR